ncbi:2014_t:CDS:2, partial [Dentiscutata heterogama]
DLNSYNPRIGKKPDVMVLVKHEQKVDELVYVECSRVVCTNTKRDDDAVKLWREALDGISYVGKSCRPASNQFGIVGIQVAGEVVHLNVLMLDGAGIPRYFHLDQAEIPLTTDTPWRVKPLIRLLLTLRNTLIVNKSLLKRALEQADTNPPRNARPSPAVSSPTREEQARTRKKDKEKTNLITKLEQNNKEKMDLIAKLEYDVSLIKGQDKSMVCNQIVTNISQDIEPGISDSYPYFSRAEKGARFNTRDFNIH